MARKKQSGGGGPGSGDWLNTYADMVTLLLTFFILLFSMSSLDANKFNLLVTAFSSEGDSSDVIVLKGEADGTEQKGGTASGEQADSEVLDIDAIAQALQEYIEEKQLQDSVEVAKGEGYVFIRFMDDMLFEPNSAVLKSKDKEILNFVGVGIKSIQSEANSINIVGHTAAIPDDPDYAVSDRKLSTERANAVLMYFEDDIGIDPMKMLATGMGKWQPLAGADNNTESGRAKNRRVEILISSEGNSLSEQLDNVYEKLVE